MSKFAVWGIEQQPSKFNKLNLRTQEDILLFGYNSENKDYLHLNIKITQAVQHFLLKTKIFEM